MTSLRRWLLLAIAVLYGVSIPWYRESGAVPTIWFGLPDWVAVAVACYVAIAVLNAVAWLRTDVSDDGPEAGEGG
jgi:hypothetical protein